MSWSRLSHLARQTPVSALLLLVRGIYLVGMVVIGLGAGCGCSDDVVASVVVVFVVLVVVLVKVLVVCSCGVDVVFVEGVMSIWKSDYGCNDVLVIMAVVMY